MVGSWFGPSEALKQVQATGSRLGIFTLTLTNVEDPFDPDPLWYRRYGGGPRIAEAQSGDREFRLQATLDGCRNAVFERDSAGRFREANPVFTDVVMWIPRSHWRSDAMRVGGRLQALRHGLEVLHADKFSRSLPEGRQPQYTVMADDRAAEDSVTFQFGFGVFVPGVDDELVAEISLYRHGESERRPVQPWLFWQDGAQTHRPVGVYRNQRTLLLSGSRDGPIRPDLWFRDCGGNVLVNLNEADTERVYADTGEIEVVEQRKPSDESGVLEWRLEHRGGDRPESLWLRIAPIAKPGVKPRPATKLVSLAPDLDSAAHDISTPLSMGFSLHVVGLGLFRIAGANVSNLEEWNLWLDEAGWPLRLASLQGRDEATCTALRMRRGSAKLEFRAGGGADFEPVASLPSSLPTANGESLELRPSPVPDRYEAILMLDDMVVLPLSPKTLTLGRATQSEAAEPDLPVELLDHPRGTRWNASMGGKTAPLDAIELSRRHLAVTLRGAQLEVAIARGQAPAFVLDEDLGMLAELKPGVGKPVLLEPEQHLLVGSYLLRFAREKALAVASTKTFRIPVPPQ